MADMQEYWQEILQHLTGDKVRFNPIKGPQEAINNINYCDGNVYFATDTKMIWLDTKINGTTQRILMGNGSGGSSSNVGFIYANASFETGSLEQPDLEQPVYYIYKQAFPEDLIGLPLVDTLIINSNGWFFRVVEQGVGQYSNRVTVELISSGTGEGGGGGSQASNIKIQLISFPTNLINGKEANVVFIPYAAKDRNGNNIDDAVTIAWKLEYTENGNTFIQYANGIIMGPAEYNGLLPSGEVYSFNFGEKARYSSTSRLTLTISELNSTNTYTVSQNFITSDLSLTLPSTFSNNSVFDTTSVTLSCYQDGNMDKILEFYWDGELIASKILDNNSDREQTLKVKDYVDEITHGYHIVKIVLSQYINGIKGFSVEPLEFEIATKNPNNNTPIIWLGNYKSVYYNYDNIQIPFRVYVSSGIPKVHLYKENKELEGSPREIVDTSKFSIFEIVDFDLNMLNMYSITCEEDPEHIVKRDIEFTVEQDPNRLDFGIQQADYLTLNFDASGRSNSESELRRQSWSYTQNGQTYNAVFDNFNWYNNGWITENSKTCLRISNGARFSIPIGDMIFAGQSDREQSHTFEFQFKIRNVQDYSNLIHNVTRYQNDGEYFNLFYDTEHSSYKTDYTNYDAFLANYFKTNHVSFIDSNGVQRDMEYDDLVFDHVEKQINLNAVACGFYSGNNQSVVGICLGPQDAFFSNGTNTVNVDYVEDNIINLSAVYSHTAKLMYIYINGVLTGVIKNTVNGSFGITSTDNTIKSLIFNSQYCDIDLYKVRFYRKDLNVNDIVTNFAVDLKDVLIYDQNKLAVENSAIGEYQFNYKKMLDYNAEHIDSPIMPYIIFDTSNSNNDDKLSYAKSVKVNIGVEFVNTPLDLAYTTGELETLSGPDGDRLWNSQSTAEEKAEAVKYYYQHHCPSWKGDIVSMAVQGTSSEFYPRRNYKLKTKDSDGNINIMLNRGPFASDYEHDMIGLTLAKYIISTKGYDESATYYTDKNGTEKVTFSEEIPYEPNHYYILNPDYVEYGKESTRQKYWYMDNYTAGTTKFTMKIDYMESSGTYNMGFANMVKNAYSKHPFDDLNAAGAFNEYDVDQTNYEEATSYKAGTTYYYKNHKGNWKNTVEDELQIQSAEDFALGPVAYAQAHEITKVLTDTASEYYNKWYKAVFGYKTYTVPNTNDYRTSVQGFRTLAFHKKSDGSYTYIGMYNMLLDKGSDEIYGFKPDKTTGVDVFQKFLGNKKISKIAECWEGENNSRTFCSFKDPMNRKDLSFNVYTMNGSEKVPVLNSVGSAPVIADSFEYRYHTDADILDYVYNPDKEGDKYESSDTIAYMQKNGDLAFDKENPTENYENRAKVIFDSYKNWEKAVAWVWSTNADSVKSGGRYTEVEGLGNLWQTGIYYLFDPEANDGAGAFLRDDSDSYDPTKNYYVKDGDHYNSAYLGTVEYRPNTYYVDINGTKVISIDDFDPTQTYYSFTALTDTEMAEDGEFDRLVRKCSSTDSFDNSITYYTYDGEQSPGHAVVPVVITEEQYNAEPDKYWVGITVSYGNSGRTYTYDTKEYRADKFINELADHFDIEYLSTYFVMTEVFECYDSRGKNAMFASWGPQKQGGDYIWYPIFYDIDTQLGINNTGIPSFEYNVDATENGNFSTSDSVLWNNFYKYFKNSRILMKYKHLKGVNAGVSWQALSKPPLRSVANIEGWYKTDPDICGSITMRGRRPLIATNLDEYYKYITITNSVSYQNGVTGHISSDTYGTWVYDANGTYFYALQGDRSLSRQQFLTNRLEYIDSWLNQGNYARGGSNRMWGRISANNPTDTSDIWLEDPADPATSYWLDAAQTQKRHPFDAEYWLTLTPTHSTYVTLGDDNEAYPSKKYDGLNPVKFDIASIESGVRTSPGYPEQLLYVYGMNQMSDIGDMSKMYWREFKIEGDAKHLTKLLLGYDGAITDFDNNGIEREFTWKNDHLNPPSIPSSKEASGMPLLKEVNMSNIQITDTAPTLDLTSCEKLQSFRATGSNLTEVKFAEGVALDTLYLPNSITTLELTEARLLRRLITSYTRPTLINDKLVAEQGLWIDGLFNNNTTSINRLSIVGGNLGYDSYKLLKKHYDCRGGNNATAIAYINMVNVEWSPYTLAEIDEVYSGDPTDYKIVNNHYGLQDFSYNEGEWQYQLDNKEIYKVDKTISADVIHQISDIEMFKTFITNSNYQGLNNVPTPNITGIIYVDNDIAEDENYIRNTLQRYFPSVTFFFKTVTAKPTARFIYLEDDGKHYHYVTENPLSIQTVSNASAENNLWFDHPIQKYGNLNKFLANYDFFGWAEEIFTDEEGDNIYSVGTRKFKVITTSTADGGWSRPEGDLALNYTFYAVFSLHAYRRTYINADNTPIVDIDLAPLINYQTYSSGYGVDPPRNSNGGEIIPTYNLPDTEENFYYVNKFKGWALTKQPGVVQDFSRLPIGDDYSFIAVYEKVSVYDNVLDQKYLLVENITGNVEDGYAISVNRNYALSGKITLPTVINNIPVVQIGGSIGTGFSATQITHIFWADPPREENGTTTRALRRINGGALKNMPALRYYEQPNTCREIGNNAFENSPLLGADDPMVIKNILKPVTSLGTAIFMYIQVPTFYIPGHSYTSLASNSFGVLSSVQTIQIGGEGDPCLWEDMVATGQLNDTSRLFNGFRALLGPGGNLIIYTRDGQPPSGLMDSMGNYKYFDFTYVPTTQIVQA